MDFKVKQEFEFFEIINTFPFLAEIIEKYDISSNNIEEGVTIYEFLKNNQKYSDEEIKIFLKKINFDIKYYFKHGKIPPEKTTKKEGKLLVLMEEE